MYTIMEELSTHSLLTDMPQTFNNSTNISLTNSNISKDYYSNYAPMEDDSSFFDTYFSWPRFGVATSLALLSILISTLALISGAMARKKRYRIYHILFINLCVSNILSAAISWLCNNLFFLFSDQLITLMFSQGGLCKMFTYLAVASFVSLSFSVISVLTLLGFIAVQYVAICHPLQHLSKVHKKKVIICILLSWLITFVVASIPPAALMMIISREECSAQVLDVILSVVIYGADSCVALVILVYIAVVGICFRIYREILALQHRLSQFRFDQEVKGERKAFVTSLMLLAILTVFFIPYSVVYVISLHHSNWQDMNNSALIYYMSILPYLKFLSDPLIYGLRMKEIRGSCRQLCGCYMHCNTSHEMLNSTSVRSTTSFQLR